MADRAENASRLPGSRWRLVPWAMLALLLLLPLVAIQFTDEVDWDVNDIFVMGAMLFGACGAFELAARMAGNMAYRPAIGVAVVAMFLLLLIYLAIGIIGSEYNPANLMYFTKLAVGVAGVFFARFQPDGMARALVTTALAQGLVAVLGWTAGLGSEGRTIRRSSWS